MGEGAEGCSESAKCVRARRSGTREKNMFLGHMGRSGEEGE